MTLSFCLLFILVSSSISPQLQSSFTDDGTVPRVVYRSDVEMPTIPVVASQRNLSRTPIVRINEPAPSVVRNEIPQPSLIVQKPAVKVSNISTKRARQTFADDGSSEVSHRVDIIAPPDMFLGSKSESPGRLRTTITTSRTETINKPTIPIASATESINSQPVVIKKERAKSNITPSSQDSLVDGPLTSSQQTLFQDEHDMNPNLKTPVQVNEEDSGRLYDMRWKSVFFLLGNYVDSNVKYVSTSASG